MSRRLIQERDELLAMIGGSAEPHGSVNVTCSIALGERFIAPIVWEYSEAYPSLSVNLDLTNRLVDLVGESYDLGIRTGHVSDARLISRQVASRAFETCAAPRYLSACGEPDSIAALNDHACLVGSNTIWHFQDCGVPQNIAPKPRWRCNSGSVIANAAVAGGGICQLPLFYVREHMAAGRLVPVLPSFQAPLEPIWAVYPSRRHTVPKVRNLVDLLTERLGPKIDATCGPLIR